jgi:hypothetical protein
MQSRASTGTKARRRGVGFGPRLIRTETVINAMLRAISPLLYISQEYPDFIGIITFQTIVSLVYQRHPCSTVTIGGRFRLVTFPVGKVAERAFPEDGKKVD